MPGGPCPDAPSETLSPHIYHYQVTLGPISRWRRKMGRQKEEGITGEEMTLYMGNREGEREGVTVPSWRQAGLWSKCPLLPAESLHPHNGAHSPPNRAGPSTQMLMVRGQEGTGGVLPVLRPQCARHRLPASLAVGRGPQGC